MELVNVIKIAGVFYVADHNGEMLIGYRNKKNADQFARGHAMGIFNAAETYNERFNFAREYLAKRAVRVYAPVSQLELF